MDLFQGNATNNTNDSTFARAHQFLNRTQFPKNNYNESSIFGSTTDNESSTVPSVIYNESSTIYTTTEFNVTEYTNDSLNWTQNLNTTKNIEVSTRPQKLEFAIPGFGEYIETNTLPMPPLGHFKNEFKNVSNEILFIIEITVE